MVDSIKYCIDVKFPKFSNFTMVILENTIVLRKRTVKRSKRA